MLLYSLDNIQVSFTYQARFYESLHVEVTFTHIENPSDFRKISKRKVLQH